MSPNSSDRQFQSAVLALGSNLADRAQYLQGAVDELAAAPGVRVAGVSPVIETDPVGGPEQGQYLNAIVQVATVLLPAELLELCQRLEASALRVREERWGPRTLDVDIITYGQLDVDTPTLTLPHPRAHLRAFVLAPWAMLDPAAVLMVDGVLEPVSNLAAIAEDADGWRATDVTLQVPACD